MYKKTITALVIMLAIAGISPAAAQIRKIPAAVTEAFKVKYAETKNVQWSDKLTVFKASFEMFNRNYKAAFTSKGEWKYEEKYIEKGELPAAVVDGLDKSKYKDWEIKFISFLQTPAKKLYKLFVRRASLNKKYLYFTESGQLEKDAITL